MNTKETHDVKALYQGYCFDAVYPRHIGGFIGHLCDKHGWLIIESTTSGARTADSWTLRTPAGNGVEVTSWNDGQVRVNAVEGWTLMSDAEYREIYSRVAAASR